MGWEKERLDTAYSELLSAGYVRRAPGGSVQLTEVSPIYHLTDEGLKAANQTSG